MPGLLEPRDRILAPIANRDADGNVTGANLGALIRRLLLFEEVIIDSFAMRELPALIEAVGTGPFIELLQTGVVRIRGDGWTMGETGNTGPMFGRPALPPLTFSVASIVPAKESRREHIENSLGEIRAMELGRKTSQRVRRAIVDSLTPFPENAGLESMRQASIDLTMRLDLVKAAADQALRVHGGIDPTGIEYRLVLHAEDADTYRAETDVPERFSIDVEEADRIIERAVIAVASLSSRFEQMSHYGAVAGFRDEELPLLDAKLSALLAHSDPEVQEQRFTRVMEVAGLPDPAAKPDTVNIERLLEARESDECREFRRWLRSLDYATDAEIAERVDSLAARIAAVVHGPGGKAVRFAVTTAADLLPFGGRAADIGIGAIDEFILDRILPEPGPISFLSSKYRSLFDG